MMDAAMALKLLAKTQMVSFTESDWDAFAGCTSKGPMIGHDGTHTIIVDGDTISIVLDNEEHTFTLIAEEKDW